MRERWREFARENAMFYIATNNPSWDRDEFYASGREMADDMLAWAGDGLGRERMVEIGCGIGRLLVNFAPHFEEVVGVDIAPEMLEQARSNGMPSNVRLALTSGSDLAALDDSDIDFAFSFIVLQHIPDPEVIAAYLREVRRVLRPTGVAALQFDTRPRTLVSRVAFALPDFMLPRTRRRYIRRYRLTRDALLEMVSAAGLEVTDERDPGTEMHFVLLRPARS